MKYKPGTSLFEIIHDGWSRGFEAEQTHLEALQQGYEIDLKSVRSFFQHFTAYCELTMEKANG